MWQWRWKNIWKRRINNGRGIAFNGKGMWRFGNGFARNVVNFGFDNTSSSHSDSILVLGERPTEGISDSVRAASKRFRITFSKAKTKFSLSLHYNDDEIYLYVNETEIWKLRQMIT